MWNMNKVLYVITFQGNCYGADEETSDLRLLL